MIDEEIVEAWDDYLSEDEIESWIGGFYPAFMKNSQTEGKTWGIPFQRSTPVIYWNKEAFEAAGLDPETPPTTWDEMVEMGQQLTIRDDAGNVTQWGLRIPSSGFPSWLFTGLVAANGQDGLANEAGTEVYSTRRKSSRRSNIWSRCRPSTKSWHPASSTGVQRRAPSWMARARSCGPRPAI